MGAYDNAVALARRLIDKKGGPLTLRSFMATAGADPEKPWRPGGNTAVDQTPRGVFLDYEEKYVDGTSILRGDQRVFLAADGLTAPPEEEGLVIRGTQTWKIIKVKELKPGEQSIMFELQVRK